MHWNNPHGPIVFLFVSFLDIALGIGGICVGATYWITGELLGFIGVLIGLLLAANLFVIFSLMQDEKDNSTKRKP